MSMRHPRRYLVKFMFKNHYFQNPIFKYSYRTQKRMLTKITFGLNEDLELLNYKQDTEISFLKSFCLHYNALLCKNNVVKTGCSVPQTIIYS